MRKVRLLTAVSFVEGLAQAGDVVSLPERQAFDYVKRQLAALEAGEEGFEIDAGSEAAALNLEQNEKAIIPKARRRG